MPEPDEAMKVAEDITDAYAEGRGHKEGIQAAAAVIRDHVEAKLAEVRAAKDDYHKAALRHREQVQLQIEIIADRDRTIAEQAAEIEKLRDEIDKLIVAIEWEVPPIRDGVDADSRLSILMACAQKARTALNKEQSDAG